MPEGPSIIILKELLLPYKGKKIVSATGTAKIDMDILADKKIVDFKSWGKHTLICLKGFYIKIHLLMFGTYRINERKKSKPRLSLKLKYDEINFYTCSVKLIEGDINKDYDFEVDIMADEWKPLKAQKIIKKLKDVQVCDLLLNQEIFSGSGNIIKNEVLFRTKIHPESLVEYIPAKKLKELVNDVRTYSFDFLRWKKDFTLTKHWLVYSKKTCRRCKIPIQKKHIGKGKRISYFCNNCQVLYK